MSPSLVRGLVVALSLLAVAPGAFAQPETDAQLLERLLEETFSKDELALMKSLRDAGGGDALTERLKALDLASLERVARDMSQYVHLVNVSEERLRLRASSGQPGPIREAVARLKAHGVTASEMRTLLDRLMVM